MTTMALNKFYKSILSKSLNSAFKTSQKYSQSNVIKPNALRSRKAKSVNSTVQYYVDKCRVRAMGGSGGDGCISLLSVWCNDRAGPDGGDGGNGGHVLFCSTYEMTSLNHCLAVSQAKAGEKGYNREMHGKNAEHTILKVPLGTIVKDSSGKVIADLDQEGMMFMAARGGAGGKGNKFFTSNTEQTPEIAEFGAEGESHVYTLEVRSIAHIGLLGFPNAGKSTLLRAISRARPRVAPYPFTTLHPHIGMVQYDDFEQVAVADLPGLIPGSHKNRGLGIQFLQHVERCCCLLWVIDISLPEPVQQMEALQYELEQFNIELTTRPQLIIANKIDLPDAKNNLPILKNHFKDIEVIPISGKVGTNISYLLKVIRKMYDDRVEKIDMLNKDIAG